MKSYKRSTRDAQIGAITNSKSGIAVFNPLLKKRIGKIFWYFPSPLEPERGLNAAILSGSFEFKSAHTGILQASAASTLA